LSRSWFLNTILQYKIPRIFEEIAISRVKTGLQDEHGASCNTKIIRNERRKKKIVVILKEYKIQCKRGSQWPKLKQIKQQNKNSNIGLKSKK
jgi:hypothetical protein